MKILSTHFSKRLHKLRVSSLLFIGAVGARSLAFADPAINATVTTDPALHAMLPPAIQSSGVIHAASRSWASGTACPQY